MGACEHKPYRRGHSTSVRVRTRVNIMHNDRNRNGEARQGEEQLLQRYLGYVLLFLHEYIAI